MARTLELERTAGWSEGSRFQSMESLEFDDLFEWQTQFCALAEIDIPSHSIDSMLDDLPELHDTDIAATPLPVVSLPSSSTFCAPAVTSPSCNHAAIAASTPTVAATATATTAVPLMSSNIGLQYVQAPASLVRSGSVFGTRPVIEIPSCESFSPPASTPTSVTTPLRSDVRSRREPSVNTHSAHRSPPAAKAKKSRATKAPSKKAKKESAGTAVKQPKKIPMPTKAEHIIRERQRRDDMATKYMILESLLPYGAKRERAVIVEDAMLFVKNLQHRKQELLKRRAQMKLNATNAGMSPGGHCKSAPHPEPGATPSAAGISETVSPSSSSMVPEAKPVQEPIIAPTVQALSISEDPIKRSVKTLQIHARLPEEIIVEMVCSQPPANFQSLLMQTVDSLNLEVSSCSIHRLPQGFVQCMMIAKPQTPPHANHEIQSSASMMGALRAAFEHISCGQESNSHTFTA